MCANFYTYTTTGALQLDKVCGGRWTEARFNKGDRDNSPIEGSHKALSRHLC